MKGSGKLLVIASILSFAVAVFQAIISLSPPWSLYFGAPAKVVANTTLLYISGEITALIFALFGFYAISGAGNIPKLPLLRTILAAITALYLLRGALFFLQLMVIYKLMFSRMIIPIQTIMSSAVSLVIGILYLLGTIDRWKNLSKKNK